MRNICLQMNRKAWLTIAMVMFLAFPALAQRITVTGTVVDPEGEPLIGASVLAQGTTNGTATDIDGNFSLDVDANATLVVSYVGYNTQEVAVNGRTRIDVTMSENSVMLSEVVAIGYGVVKKTDATGSVAVIKPDDIEMATANSVQDLLVGASPGVTVTSNGGNPTGSATIRIRGGSSLTATNDPLIVIDGVPQTGGDMINGTGVSAMTMLNPNDIESMTVLKDASATAIYGSRASNGVIIITTKKGQSGRPKVAFAANWHYAKARKTYKVMDGDQMREMANKYYGENGLNGTNLDWISELGTENTDWQDLVLRGAFSQDYSLSVSGTAGWLPYRVSAGWAGNDGIIKDNSMQRTTVGFNLSPKFFNGKLSINANATGTYIRLRGYGNEGVVGSAIYYNPTVSPYATYPMTSNSVGQLYRGLYYLMSGSVAQSQGQGENNPLDALHNYDKTGETYSSTGNLQIDYALHFLPELHLNLNLGYEVSKSEKIENSLPGSNSQLRNTTLLALGSYGAGTQFKWWQLNRNTLLDFYLNYRKDFAAIQSNLDVMAGYSWQRFSYLGHQDTFINTMGYVIDPATTFVPMVNGEYDLQWDQASAANIGTPVTNAYKRWSAPHQLVSFFGRINYSLQDTYLFTFTLRDDGSSRFSPDTRWGVFPSVALGWRIGNMPVFEPVRDWWNELKLRAGWGITGQQDVGDEFPWMAVYTYSDGSYYYPDPTGNGEWIYPLYPGGYDASLRWEKTTTWNVGLDFGFLNNRITAAVDWYLRQTRDLLYSANISGLGTQAQIKRNIGDMRNAGVEFTLTARPIVTKDFTWSTGFNYAYNDSKITKLTGDNAGDVQQAEGIPGVGGTAITVFAVDQEPRAFQVFQQIYNADGDPIPGAYVDQNGDGVINDSDLIFYHSPAPAHTFSWNNTFNWKNWDLGFTLRANLGNYVYNNSRRSRTSTVNLYQYGWCNLLADTYLFGDTSSDTHFAQSSYFVENASFLRCDNISLGYTFDDLLGNKVGLRVFAVVQNPFVITKYTGIDPEVYGGVDNSVYPNPTTYTLGLTLNF